MCTFTNIFTKSKIKLEIKITNSKISTTQIKNLSVSLEDNQLEIDKYEQPSHTYIPILNVHQSLVSNNNLNHIHTQISTRIENLSTPFDPIKPQLLAPFTFLYNSAAVCCRLLCMAFMFPL